MPIWQTEVTDLDKLYNAYLCNVGPNAVNSGPQNPENPSRPDSINIFWENVESPQTLFGNKQYSIKSFE